MSESYSIRLLQKLAHLYGIQTSYYDVTHHRNYASAESLLAVLKVLNAPVENYRDILSALRERRYQIYQKPLQPIIVAWNGQLKSTEITLPYAQSNCSVQCHLNLENGEKKQWILRLSDGELSATEDLEGSRFITIKIPLLITLPIGYHQLVIELEGKLHESLIISAPTKAYSYPQDTQIRKWGIFTPLYSLHSHESWGAGSYSDLNKLKVWAKGMGSQVIATLPLLPTFMDYIYNPSPYLPVSRLLWNEFFLDINKVQRLHNYLPTKDIIESASFQNEINLLNNLELVDYRRQMALKRTVLEEFSRNFFSEETELKEDLYQFVKASPNAEDYACFRATGEKQGTTWRSWPQRLKKGLLAESDYDLANKHYHLYVQWLAHKQMSDITRGEKKDVVLLYLDLPVGVHPDGYDVWHERDIFITGASAGAPPDTLFTKGQNWGFPPLNPQTIREQKYQYVVNYLRHHLKHASILRIDHVMGLHRLFCIPAGLKSSQGVYIRYNAEEFYAILSLESRRHKVILVGEDLGTVPSYVRSSMKKHGLYNMYVAHYELASNIQNGLPQPHAYSVASLNTHDMPPFAALWQGLDIDERLGFGFLDTSGAEKERNERDDLKQVLLHFLRVKGLLGLYQKSTISVLKACLYFLAASPVQLLLVNLEDLWLETKSQNIPSTNTEHPNWQRKMRYCLEDIFQKPQVTDILNSINKIRKRNNVID